MAAEDVAAGRQGDRLGRVFASINSFVSLNNQIPRLQVTYCFVGPRLPALLLPRLQPKGVMIYRYCY